MEADKADSNLTVGSIVCSKAGRDDGRYFVVMWQKENFVG